MVNDNSNPAVASDDETPEEREQILGGGFMATTVPSSLQRLRSKDSRGLKRSRRAV